MVWATRINICQVFKKVKLAQPGVVSGRFLAGARASCTSPLLRTSTTTAAHEVAPPILRTDARTRGCSNG